eukprot:TRINITY_DN41519_c0_g1_i1.p1 TRINITY_DN41519_c0_g1~~TRINITY_DN41519_c0_g1_i1.p1  ORF type:complete len:475 (+),score=30.82 TRINITY_DN41519_c0_g1_i1:60-1427(+)
MGCTHAAYSWIALVLAVVLGLIVFTWLCLALRASTITQESLHPTTGKSPRCALLDNIKFILILGVTATHYLGMLRPMLGTGMVGRFCLPFCLRIFVFVSGVVSRSPPSKKAFRSMLWRVAVPFVAYCTVLDSFILQLPFQNLQSILHDFPRKSILKLVNKRGAAGTAWYLQALVIWRLLGFATWNVPGKTRFVIALAVSSFVGYIKLDEIGLDLFSATHALHSWPVFVLGQVLPWQELIAAIKWTPRTSLLGRFLLLSMFAIEAWDTSHARFIDVMPADQWGSNFQLEQWLDFGWNEVSGPRYFCTYTSMSVFWFRGLFRHAWELTKGLILCFLCCPRTRTPYTKWGMNSLYPYLLQLFFLRLIEHVYPDLWPAFLKGHFNVWWGVAVSWTLYWAVMVAVVALLASWPIRPLVALVLEPEWLWDCATATQARIFMKRASEDESDEEEEEEESAKE